MFVIFDLDGTLALCDHRRHHLQKTPKDWDAFNAACVDDTPNLPIMALMENLIGDHWVRIEIWSGRNESQRVNTVKWLARHYDGRIPQLLMRPEKDYRPDEELKGGWLDAAIAAGRTPDLVFDDRDRMVAMWRSRGIVCCQVAPGDF